MSGNVQTWDWNSLPPPYFFEVKVSEETQVRRAEIRSRASLLIRNLNYSSHQTSFQYLFFTFRRRKSKKSDSGSGQLNNSQLNQVCNFIPSEYSTDQRLQCVVCHQASRSHLIYLFINEKKLVKICKRNYRNYLSF